METKIWFQPSFRLFAWNRAHCSPANHTHTKTCLSLHRNNTFFCVFQLCWETKGQNLPWQERRDALCSKHNSFRMAQRLSKGWTLNAPLPRSNKQRWLVPDEPRIRTNACLSEGGALIPAGDFERRSLSRRCAHFSVRQSSHCRLHGSMKGRGNLRPRKGSNQHQACLRGH